MKIILNFAFAACFLATASKNHASHIGHRHCIRIIRIETLISLVKQSIVHHLRWHCGQFLIVSNNSFSLQHLGSCTNSAMCKLNPLSRTLTMPRLQTMDSAKVNPQESRYLRSGDIFSHTATLCSVYQTIVHDCSQGSCLHFKYDASLCYSSLWPLSSVCHSGS